MGKTFICFVVNADGSIQDVEVVKSTGDVYLDKETVRVVETMPKWSPALQSGKPVRVYYTVPVNFRLQ
ncbi:MAG: energy transducer TonB [Bacteroidaceae bacterium]|nr:energy transducer TonB [Bacteroidaceae bacterium]